MVSVAVLAMMMFLVFQMLDETQKTWSRAKGMVSTFKDAREGFEAINRTVAQATLHTYLGYDTAGSTQFPTAFARRSELHFVCGPVDQLLGDQVAEGRKRLTHALFFQAPLGFQTIERQSSGQQKDPYSELDSLLNGWGYFVEYGGDRNDRPGFLNDVQPPVEERFRSRLMEFRQPVEATTIYQYHLEQDPPKSDAACYQWFRGEKFGVMDPANLAPMDSVGSIRTTRVAAENIIALVISPRLAEEDMRNSSDPNSPAHGFKVETGIAPEYFYDTRRFQHGEKDLVGRYSRHQLPPILRVTMIAIDEVDAARYQAQHPASSGKLPTYLPDGKFFKNVSQYAEDLDYITSSLDQAHIRNRVFTTNIRIRESNFNATRDL